MTDRELLEKAAKAAGMPTLVWGGMYMVGGTEVDCTDFAYVPSASPDEAPAYWNPLDDDGDALRLAVALGIDLEWRADGRVAAYRHATSGGFCFTAFESSREDRAANTRRAIVRAAAAIADQEGEA